MKIIYLIILLIFQTFISYTQNNTAFEGDICIFSSQNISNFGHEKLMRSMGNKGLEKLIASLFIKKNSQKVNKMMARYEGDSEILMKVKGNRLAYYDTSTEDIILYDGDKQKVTIAYSHIKKAIQYSYEEYIKIVTSNNPQLTKLPEETENIGEYVCRKAIINTENAEVNTTTEMWYTEQIKLPEIFLNIYNWPGLVMLSHFSLKGTMEVENYAAVTEIISTSISDDVFQLPQDYTIVTPSEIGKYLLKAAKKTKKNTIQVGLTIPNSFWDF